MTHSKTSIKHKFLSVRTLRRSLIITTIIVLTYFVVALVLIYWPRSAPFPESERTGTISENVIASQANARTLTIDARDGTKLVMTRYGAASDTVILFVHGVATDQSQMAIPAQILNGVTKAEIITLDLRGHGLSGGPRNDVDYIGQYEDDIEDVVRALIKESPGQRIILAGHSMGGGIALRYALKSDAPKPEAYLLFAPNFGEGPTERKKNDTQKDEDKPSFVYFDLPRMIGQIMMNVVGVHAFDHEPILFFNLPPRPQAYSYRAVMSGQPIRPNTADEALQAVDAPLLVVVGEDDEVFNAPAFESFVTANSKGRTQMISGETHVSILFSKRAYRAVGTWFANVNLESSILTYSPSEME